MLNKLALSLRCVLRLRRIVAHGAVTLTMNGSSMLSRLCGHSRDRFRMVCTHRSGRRSVPRSAFRTHHTTPGARRKTISWWLVHGRLWGQSVIVWMCVIIRGHTRHRTLGKSRPDRGVWPSFASRSGVGTTFRQMRPDTWRACNLSVMPTFATLSCIFSK